MDYYKLRESYFSNKVNYAYTVIGTAAAIYVYKKLFGASDKKEEPITYNSAARKKVLRKMKKIFEVQDEKNEEIKFVNKNHQDIDKFAKLKDFTTVMVEKVLVKEEIVNPKKKQDYIFYQILNSMQTRFKQKPLAN